MRIIIKCRNGGRNLFRLFSYEYSAISVAVPALAAFAICPAICAIMGGLMWFMSRSSKNKGNEQKDVLKVERTSSCCSDCKIQQQEPITDTKLISKNSKDSALDVIGDIAVPSSQHLEKHPIDPNILNPKKWVCVYKTNIKKNEDLCYFIRL